jgi:hypothetical protein
VGATIRKVTLEFRTEAAHGIAQNICIALRPIVSPSVECFATARA